jgi:lysophospholipase L1-like esterase
MYIFDTSVWVALFLQNDIPYIETLNQLRAKLDETQVYVAGLDDHPNEKGYVVIARAVYQALERLNYWR